MVKTVSDSFTNRLLQWNANVLTFGIVLYLVEHFDFSGLKTYYSPLISRFDDSRGILPSFSNTISNVIHMVIFRWLACGLRDEFPYLQPSIHLPVITYLCKEYVKDSSTSFWLKTSGILSISYGFLSYVTVLWSRIHHDCFKISMSRHSCSNNGDPTPGWPKPLVFPSRTKHTRIFPRKHSFSYAYLMVGVPVGWRGVSSSMISAGKIVSPSWFHVDSNDHLFRTSHRYVEDLRSKLDAYLRSEDQDPDDYPFAYLITAPRILGYCFNPVSFWYLYSSEKRLKAMILEVNNTFDERRMYLLGRNNTEDIIKEDSFGADQVQFSSNWKKDFHVSPFNSREGSYVLRAKDPLIIKEDATCQIRSTITLLSSENSKKLVASIYSTGPSLDPEKLGHLDKFKVLASWAWVGFFTFPRILREAWKLFFTHKLQVWFRPEVLQSSISRRPSASEIDLEFFFRKFLADVVATSKRPSRLQYIPPRGTAASEKYVFVSQNLDSSAIGEKKGREIVLEVLSPAFYSRFIHYSHVSEAFDREYICTEIKNRTLTVSQPDILVNQIIEYEADIVARHKSLPTTLHDGRRIGYFQHHAWRFLRRFRCPPAQQSYLTPPSSQQYQDSGDGSQVSSEQRDIRMLSFSALDLFVMTRHEAGNAEESISDRDPKLHNKTHSSVEKRHEITQSQQRLYIHRTIFLFMAERFAFGMEPLVYAGFFVVKYATSYLAVLLLSIIRVYVDEHSNELDSSTTLKWGLAVSWLATFAAPNVHYMITRYRCRE